MTAVFMKLLISARDLEILRKAVYGLSAKEIAADLNIPFQDVDRSLKTVLKDTQCKQPMQAMQVLASKGFELRD
jgi:DNA-binding NarL/FixJ family response regulator